MRNLTFILFFATMVCYAQEQPRVNTSSIAFTIPEKDLLPESIAYDPQEQAFYVSSTRKGKIVKVDSDGTITDFISSKQEGLWMTIGIKVDAQRRILWVCSSGGDNLIDYRLKDETDGRPAGIFKFDLRTGSLLQKFTFEKKGEVHFINDVAINEQNGDVYFTHMFSDHAVYRIPWNRNPKLFISHDSMPYPNGITIKDSETLFVAHDNGVSAISLSSKKITSLTVPEDKNISRRASIDGLYYYQWKLIGVQPGTSTVSLMPLNETGSRLEDVKIIEQNHPMMMNPTTGVMIGNEFYYIANAQFGSFDDEGALWSIDQLYEPVILKVTIE